MKTTKYREIWHLYCSLLILSLPPFLWVSPAEILSLCEVSRMMERWDGPSYLLPPSDSSRFNLSILQSRQFSSAWWRTRLWRFISAFFVVLIGHKMITYFYLLFIPLHGTRRHASVASINYVCSLTKTNVKCYWFEPAIFQGEEKTRSQLYRDWKKVPNFKSHFLSYGYIIFARARLGSWF